MKRPRQTADHDRERGFTLLEVLVSISVSSVLLVILFYLLNVTLNQWRSQTDGQINSAEARSALSYLEDDLNAIVVKNRGEAEWLRVQKHTVSDSGEMPWLTMLTRPKDADISEGGDVCAVSYRIEKKSQLGGTGPVHALYRMALSPTETAKFVGTPDMNADFWSTRMAETVSLDRFLAGYVIDFDLIFHVRDPLGNFHILEPNEEIRASRDVLIGTKSGQNVSVPDGSHLSSVEIRLTVVNRGGQQLLNSKAMSIEDIKTRYGRTYLTVVEFPHPSF